MATSIVTLQDKLFKKLGVSTTGSGPARLSRLSSRKEKRKATRAQKKTQGSALEKRKRKPLGIQKHTDETDLITSPKKRKREEAEDGLASSWPNEDAKMHGGGLDMNSSSGDDVSGTSLDRTDKRPRLADQGVSNEDAMIMELERKLGLVKKQKRSLKNGLPLDGLDEIFKNLGDEDEDGDGDDGGDDDDDDDDDGLSTKDAEYAKWLAEKRNRGRRVSGFSHTNVDADDDEDLEDNRDGKDDMLGLGSPMSGRARRHENPYKPPVSHNNIVKYVPPSRRQTGQDGADTDRLKRQLQGLFNRLTEDNLLSIVYSIDHIYQTNPRGEVTSALVDIVMAQVCKPEVLPDPFFILIGGFISAIYKIVGTSFGSVMLREVVVGFRTEYDRVSQRQSRATDWNKEASNLLTLIASLYVFDVVGQRLVFDCLQLLLEELSEVNAELTLRIIRMAGPLLRKDDPIALRDTVASINKSVARAGGNANLPARTRYMIEAINDLKANRARAMGGEPALVSERIRHMNKRLRDLKSQSRRRLDGTAAMGVSLKDIEDADINGKWWLVGASVLAVKAGDRQQENSLEDGRVLRSDNLSDDSATENDVEAEEDMDMVVPDYRRLAREQGLTTNVQISIFTALMSAVDANHGYQQFLALRLGSSQRREIARVLVECVSSEATYNPYYAIVAKMAASCNNVRFAFQNRLWALFRQMGEPLFGEEDDNRDQEEEYSACRDDHRRISHLSRFFGALLSSAVLSITILKPLDLHHLQPPTQTLIEHMFTTILQESVKSPLARRESFLRQTFDVTTAHPGLVDGIRYILGHPRGRPAAMPKKQAADVALALKMAKEVLDNT